MKLETKRFRPESLTQALQKIDEYDVPQSCSRYSVHTQLAESDLTQPQKQPVSVEAPAHSHEEQMKNRVTLARHACYTASTAIAQDGGRIVRAQQRLADRSDGDSGSSVKQASAVERVTEPGATMLQGSDLRTTKLVSSLD